MRLPAVRHTNALYPAFIELYRLLITYPDDDMTAYVPERLAVSLTQPVIAGDALPWSSERISLAEIAELTTCADNLTGKQPSFSKAHLL